MRPPGPIAGDELTAPQRLLRLYGALLALAWTVVVAASLAWNLSHFRSTALEMTRIQARAYFEKDLILRHWVSQIGGVYARITEDVQPNAYLAVADRDVTSSSGRALTLLNPAYLTRLLFEEERKVGFNSHLTSLRPLRPENKPDPWEAEALHAFDRGTSEVSSLWLEGGQRRMRLMRPLVTEKSCLVCHAAQNYREGDIRGGISVSVPLDPVERLFDDDIVAVAASHGGVWFVGIVAITFGARRIRLDQEKRAAAERALAESNVGLEQRVQERTRELGSTNLQLMDEIGVRTRAEEDLRRQTEEQVAINNLLHMSIGSASTEQILGKALDILVSIRWLSVEPRGSIFLLSDAPETLRMAAHKDLPEPLVAVCQNVAFGQCLCGRAAARREVVYKSSLDPEHETVCPEMRPHGHYCVPLHSQGRTLGVINLYLRDGHEKNDREIVFLTAVADTLAGIVARRQAEQERDRVREQLRAKERLATIGETVANVSHCIKNLLAPLRGAIGLLDKHIPATEGSEARTLLEIVQRASNRLYLLIMEMLDYSKEREPLYESTTLRSVFREVEELLCPQAANSDVEIRVELRGEEYVIETDVHRLVRALLNLGTNALDAMPEGGTLTLHAAACGQDDPVTGPAEKQGFDAPGYLLFQVTDTGNGMDAETIGHLFQPFFSTKGSRGTGLGLSFVKSFVDDSGGTITVDSVVGRGTTFRIVLPCRKLTER